MKVLLIGPFASAGRPLLDRFLRTQCEIHVFPRRFNESQVLAEIESADVIVGAPFTKKMGQHAKKLRLVQNTGAGIDRYELSSFPPGVRFCVSYHHESAIAEYVIMVILALTRRLIPFDAQLREGQWGGSCIFSPLFTVRELTGATLGLIGLGRIGREIARRAVALGLRVCAVKQNPMAPYQDPAIEVLGSPANLSDLLGISDYVVVACPLTPETDGLIGREQFELMKRDSCLINVSRGKIVQEDALYEALRTHQIAGAAIDVWYNYPSNGDSSPCPPSSYPFHELNNVIMTPHISSCTVEAVEARWRDIAFNIDHLPTGEPLRNEVIF